MPATWPVYIFASPDKLNWRAGQDKPSSKGCRLASVPNLRLAVPPPLQSWTFSKVVPSNLRLLGWKRRDFRLNLRPLARTLLPLLIFLQNSIRSWRYPRRTPTSLGPPSAALCTFSGQLSTYMTSLNTNHIASFIDDWQANAVGQSGDVIAIKWICNGRFYFNVYRDVTRSVVK